MLVLFLLFCCQTAHVCDFLIIFLYFQFLVLDEADRVLDVGFEEELKVIFQCLPRNRQTLLFSATMTKDLETLLELSANKAYFYEAYEGFKTVDMLKQQYVFIPKDVKDLYLLHILSKMEDMGIRSAIIFVQTCKYGFFLAFTSLILHYINVACFPFKKTSLILSLSLSHSVHKRIDKGLNFHIQLT